MNREIKFRAWDKRIKKMRAVAMLNFIEEHDYEEPERQVSEDIQLVHLIYPEYEDWCAREGRKPNLKSGKTYSVELNEVILTQYTGLKDKNGVEIYEGDVVATDEIVASDGKPPNGDYIDVRKVENFEYYGGKRDTRYFGRKLMLVEWKDSSCGFEPFSDSVENCGHCGGGTSSKNLEVIGNVYESPELINKE